MPNRCCAAIPHRTKLVSATVLLLLAFSFSLTAQTPTPSCQATSTNPNLHAESLAERVGDLTLICSGGVSGAVVQPLLYITLNTTVTNRLDANGSPTGITTTVDTGTGPVTVSPSFRLSGGSTLVVNVLSYTVPAVVNQSVSIKFSGIRAAVAPLASGTTSVQVTASIVGIGVQLPVGLAAGLGTTVQTLLASAINNGVPCNGSLLPSTLDFNGFLNASTSVSTVRVTEVRTTSFTAKQPGDDSGVRFLVKLSGYGSASRIFVPDAIVGNTGLQATSAGGAYGRSFGPGTYVPGAGQLLLIRVTGSDANGGGGALTMPQPGVVTTFSSMSELAVANGSAYAVYEVADSNSVIVESAQIPVFVVAAPVNCPSTLNPAQSVTLAPASTVVTATTTDPIPRFMAGVPPLDCTQESDCTSGYFPSLYVDQTPISLTGTSLGGPHSAPIKVGNLGSGILSFTSSVTYQSGSGWLTVNPSSGANSITVNAIANPAALQPGTYTATITISAGAYGTATIPVTFTVALSTVTIQNVGNAASFQYGTVAPGSYAVLYGLNLAGTNVGVTFNGLAANIIYKSATQINLVVPTGIAGQVAAAVVVTVDGAPSSPFTVNLAPNLPGIFNPGVVNFNGGQINSAVSPAARGDYILIFLTGLTVPLTGQVTVNFGPLTNQIPAFAGAQPTLPALDQINILVPAASPTGLVPLQVCIPGPAGQPVCSNQVSLYVK